MFTVVTNAGRIMLDQTRNSDYKIQLSRFQLGLLDGNTPDLSDQPYDFDVNNYIYLKDETALAAQFSSGYEGLPANISYIPLETRKALFKFYTPANTDYFKWNAVLLYAKINNVENIFLVTYSLVRNPKFNLEISNGGMRHFHQLTLQADNFADKFDLSNLGLATPEFPTYSTLGDVTPALQEGHDQAVLNVHENMPWLKTKHMLMNSLEQWYGNPLQTYNPSDTDNPSLIVGRSDDCYFLADGDSVPTGFQLRLDDNGAQLYDYLGRRTMSKIVS